MIGEIIADLIGLTIIDAYESLVRATYRRFGWFAAFLVALAPVAMIAGVILLIVIFVTR